MSRREVRRSLSDLARKSLIPDQCQQESIIRGIGDRQAARAPADFNNTVIFQAPSGGIPASAPPDTISKALCPVYHPRGTSSWDSSQDVELLQLLNVDDNIGSGNAEAYIYNLGEDEVPEGKWGSAQLVGGILVAEKDASGSSGQHTPQVTFKLIERIADRVVDAVIINQHGVQGLLNPIDGEPFNIGDTIQLIDYFNVLPDVFTDATGVAYWHSEALPGDENWVPITCTKPVNFAWFFLESCLLWTDTTVNARVSSTFKLSGYPYVEIPPEIQDGGEGEDPLIELRNPRHLTSIGSQSQRTMVWAVRTENSDLPEPGSMPPTGGPPGPAPPHVNEWHIVAVDQPIARWAIWEYNDGSGWTILPGAANVWEGEDPNDPTASTCNAELVIPFAPFGERCFVDKNGAQLLSCYRPETHEYVAVSGVSAFMGEPVRKKMRGENEMQQIGEDGEPGSDGCKLDESGEKEDVCFASVKESVLVFDDCTDTEDPQPSVDICFNPDRFLTCLDLCEWICKYCDWMYAADCEPPPPPPCEEYCEYIAVDVGGGTLQWQSYNECYGPDCDCPDSSTIAPPTFEGQLSGPLECESTAPEGCFTNRSSRVSSFTAYVDTVNDINVSLKSSDLHDGTSNVVNFLVDITSGSCQEQELNVPATATAHYDAVEECCYIVVEITTPTAPCILNSWPGSLIKFPTCIGGRVPDDCSPPSAPDGCNDNTSYCDEGEWNYAELTMAAVNPCPSDVVVTRIGKQATSTRAQEFVDNNAHFFRKKCGSCKNDVLAVMTRWDESGEKPTVDQVARLARTIKQKAKENPAKEIVGAILKHYDMENDAPPSDTK